MRRALLLIVAVIAILAASVAVSVARTPSEESTSAAAATVAPAIVVPQSLTHRLGGAFASLPDEAAMVLVGSALIGIAAAVRRAA